MPRVDDPFGFSTRTVHNCLNEAQTNWQRFVVLIAIKLIQYIQRFTESNLFFIILCLFRVQAPI